MSAIIGAFWPYILAGGAAALAFIYGMFQKKSADAAKSAAQAQVATVQASQAQANADALTKSAQAVAEAKQASIDLPTDEAVNAQNKKWTRD